MGSTIQLNITVPPAVAGFPQEGTQNYSQGFQLQLSITMPTTSSNPPLVQTTLASPRQTAYIESNLTEREADLRQALKQRRLNTVGHHVVASTPEAVSVSAQLHPLRNRAGSEGTSTDATLCSNGSHPGGAHYNQILEDEGPITDQKYLRPELSRSAPVIDTGCPQQLDTMVADDGHRVQPRTPPGSPHRMRSASLQSEHRNPRVERGRSRESKIIGYHRDLSPYSSQSKDYSSTRSSSPSNQSQRPRSPTRQRSRASRRSSRSSSTSLAVSHHVESEDCAPNPPSPLILRVNTRGQEVSTRPTHESNEPLSHRLGFHHNSRRICPFFHKNQEDRHPNHEPHPGYTEEEFDTVVKLYARGDDLPQSLIKANVEVNWKNHKRSSSQSPTQSTSSPMKRRFERPALRTSFTAPDNFDRPNKRQKLRQQPYEPRDQGPPRYDTTPRDIYDYGAGYVDLPEYSPNPSPLRQRFSSPNDSRPQYRSDYFMNTPTRGIYERPQGVRPHWQ